MLTLNKEVARNKWSADERGQSSRKSENICKGVNQSLAIVNQSVELMECNAFKVKGDGKGPFHHGQTVIYNKAAFPYIDGAAVHGRVDIIHWYNSPWREPWLIAVRLMKNVANRKSNHLKTSENVDHVT
jgi:hypothetical protein